MWNDIFSNPVACFLEHGVLETSIIRVWIFCVASCGLRIGGWLTKFGSPGAALVGYFTNVTSEGSMCDIID